MDKKQIKNKTKKYENNRRKNNVVKLKNNSENKTDSIMKRSKNSSTKNYTVKLDINWENNSIIKLCTDMGFIPKIWTNPWKGKYDNRNWEIVRRKMIKEFKGIPNEITPIFFVKNIAGDALKTYNQLPFNAQKYFFPQPNENE